MRGDQIIDGAPGKEFLNEIVQGSVDALVRFYEVRKAWSRGSPLINDHFVTYDFVDDLCFDPRQTDSFVPTMAEIALQETPAFFHCALTLLSNLIPDDRILPRPEGFGQQLLGLKKRVEQFSFIPNMTTTWETLVTRARCLKPVGPDPQGTGGCLLNHATRGERCLCKSGDTRWDCEPAFP